MGECNRESQFPVNLRVKEQQRGPQAGSATYPELPRNRHWESYLMLPLITELAVLQYHHGLEQGGEFGSGHKVWPTGWIGPMMDSISQQPLLELLWPVLTETPGTVEL